MMREGRNKKTFFCSMLLLVLLILFASIYYANTNTNTMPDALAIESNTLYSEIQIVCKELFGEDVNIRKAECLYNLDESADFIYVEFDSSGYAVFANQTLDILEYSLSGNLPYSSQCKKYYAGPTTYMYKENESFKNYITEESISLSEAVDYAQKSKMVLTQAQTDKGLQRKEYFKSINESEVCPGVSYLDRKGNLSSTMSSSNSGGLEIPGGGLGPGATYITNAEYFLTGPYHGQNSSGTCGAVAAQLLLSYNNYYNDRRIIQNNYLFDGEAGPNTCADPMRMTSWTLGTRGLKEDGSDDSNSYFHKVVGKIPASPTLEQQKTGMESLLNGRGTVDTGTSMATIKNEIDANRPLIINMRSDEYVGHAVVGYGYQTLGGSGTSEDGQFGYIVHYGWSPYENWTEYSNMWINQAWCYNWVRLVVPHTHSYGTTSGVFYEKGCTSCGHRKSEYPFNTTVNNGQVTITGINFTPNSELTIPSKINGNTVTKISANAFANCNTLQSVKVPNSVQEIGAGAFSGCSSLTSITLPFTGSKRTATGSASCLGYIFGTSSYTGGTATNQNGTIYFIVINIRFLLKRYCNQPKRYYLFHTNNT